MRICQTNFVKNKLQMGLLVLKIFSRIVHFTLLPVIFFRLISHLPVSHWFLFLYAMKTSTLLFGFACDEMLCPVQNEFLGSPWIWLLLYHPDNCCFLKLWKNRIHTVLSQNIVFFSEQRLNHDNQVMVYFPYCNSLRKLELTWNCLIWTVITFLKLTNMNPRAQPLRGCSFNGHITCVVDM